MLPEVNKPRLSGVPRCCFTAGLSWALANASFETSELPMTKNHSNPPSVAMPPVIARLLFQCLPKKGCLWPDPGVGSGAATAPGSGRRGRSSDVPTAAITKPRTIASHPGKRRPRGCKHAKENKKRRITSRDSLDAKICRIKDSPAWEDPMWVSVQPSP